MRAEKLVALTTESFTSIHVARVSGLRFGRATSEQPSPPVISLCPVPGVLSSPAGRRWRRCTQSVLHFLYSCVIADSNLKIHIQQTPSCICAPAMSRISLDRTSAHTES